MNTDQPELHVQICRYLDGDLSADEARAFEQRLSAEPELGAELEAFRRTDACITAWGAPVPQLDWDGCARRITAGCTAAARRRYHAPRLLRLFAPLAAAAAAVLLVLLLRADLGPRPNQVPIAEVSVGPRFAPDSDLTVVSVSYSQAVTPAPARVERPRPARFLTIVAVGALPAPATSQDSSWF